MESLNKENFWNDLQETFPGLMKEFCDWVDQYKQRKRWTDIFSQAEVKFHHLPIEMQSGIVFLFFREVFECAVPMTDASDTLEIAQTIKDTFADRFVQDQVKILSREENDEPTGPPSALSKIF